MSKCGIQIKSMLLAGKSPDEIKRAVPGADGSLIAYYRRKLEIPKFKSGHRAGVPLKPERVEHRLSARSLKAAGATYAELAKQFNVTPQCVQYWLRPKVENSGNCFRCGKFEPNLHRHHVDYMTDEIQLLCGSCHGAENGKSHHRKTKPSEPRAEMRNKVCRCCGGSGLENDHFAIGKKLREKRESRGLKAAYIASVMGISPQFISDLEVGRRCWTVDLMEKYNAALAK